MVPLFVRITNMDIHNSIATSSFCILFNSFFAVLAYSFVTPGPGFSSTFSGLFLFSLSIAATGGGTYRRFSGSKIGGASLFNKTDHGIRFASNYDRRKDAF